MIYSEKMTIAASLPLRFYLSAEIFVNGDEQIRNYENDRFWQVIRVNCKFILPIIKAVGSIYKPKVSAELKSNSSIAEEDKRKLKKLSTPFSAWIMTSCPYTKG